MNANIIQLVNSYLSYLSKNYIPNVFVEIEKNKDDFIRYLSEKLDDVNCRNFEGTDLYLSYELDGTIKQLYLIEADIIANATTERKFEGLVFFENIEELTKSIDSKYLHKFLNLLSENKNHITYCFCVDKNCDLNIANLKKQIANELNDKGILDLSNNTSR